MGSSVSSEQAFSSAGITVSKCRNRLKGDIIEALQFLKCHLRKEIIFRAPAPSSILEESLELLEDDDGDEAWVDEPNATDWVKYSINVESDSE